MAADAQGNDLKAVNIPVTGAIAFAPYGTKLPTPEEGGKKEYKLPADYKRLGLVTKDGGPEWKLEAEGDAQEFWQEGYSMPSGLASCELTFTLAQTDPVTVEFIRGIKLDKNGYFVVDAGGNPERYALYVEEIFKNSMIRRRAGANAQIKEVKESKSERGSVLGYEVTVKFGTDPQHEGGQFGEWNIFPDGVKGDVTPAAITS